MTEEKILRDGEYHLRGFENVLVYGDEKITGSEVKLCMYGATTPGEICWVNGRCNPCPNKGTRATVWIPRDAKFNLKLTDCEYVDVQEVNSPKFHLTITYPVKAEMIRSRLAYYSQTKGNLTVRRSRVIDFSMESAGHSDVRLWNSYLRGSVSVDCGSIELEGNMADSNLAICTESARISLFAKNCSEHSLFHIETVDGDVFVDAPVSNITCRVDTNSGNLSGSGLAPVEFTTKSGKNEYVDLTLKRWKEEAEEEEKEEREKEKKRQKEDKEKNYIFDDDVWCPPDSEEVQKAAAEYARRLRDERRARPRVSREEMEVEAKAAAAQHDLQKRLAKAVNEWAEWARKQDQEDREE